MGTGAGAIGPARVSLASGGSVSAVRQGKDVLLVVHDRPELVADMTLSVDHSVADSSASVLRVIAEVTPSVVLLEDSYYSRPGPLSYCQAGREQFVRVLELGAAKEALRVKVSSCLDNLELGEPGIVWNGDTQTLEIHWIGRDTAFYRIGTE